MQEVQLALHIMVVGTVELILRKEDRLCVNYTLEINNSRLCFFLCVKMNHSEAHLMILLEVVDSKVLRMAIQVECFFFFFFFFFY